MKILFLSDKEDLFFREGFLALAMQTAIDYPYTSLMLTAGGQRVDYELCFSSKRALVSEPCAYNEISAMEKLLQIEKKSKIRSEDIENIFVPVVDKHLYYLPEDNPVAKIRRELTPEENLTVIDSLNDLADIVYINAKYSPGIFTSNLVKNADILVLGIEPKMSNEGDILAIPAKLRKKCLYLIKGYEASSLYNIDRLKKVFRIEENKIMAITDNNIFSQATVMGRGEEFIKRSNFSHLTTNCSFFIKELRRSVNIMVDALDF